MAESVPARNITELSNAVNQIQPAKHKVVVLAMLTNIIVNSGNAIATLDPSARLITVEACLKGLFTDLT